MMKKDFDPTSIAKLEKQQRANLINSISGYKSANLIGTQSEKGQTNLAIFSSVTHLGSDPALVTLTLRPPTVDRHTFSNMKATGFFTINHINEKIIAQAHQTAARYPKHESEFDATGLETTYLNNFTAPFVAESNIKIGCSYVNDYPIRENGCVIIIGKIEVIQLNNDCLNDDGWVDLARAGSVCINGLDAYAKPENIDRFSYAKPDKTLDSML